VKTIKSELTLVLLDRPVSYHLSYFESHETGPSNKTTDNSFLSVKRKHCLSHALSASLVTKPLLDILLVGPIWSNNR
jgi:hypothetical protein